MADNEISGKRKRSKAFYVGQKRRVSPLLTCFKSNNFFFLKISLKPHLFAHFSEKRTRTSCAGNERSACHVQPTGEIVRSRSVQPSQRGKVLFNFYAVKV